MTLTRTQDYGDYVRTSLKNASLSKASKIALDYGTYYEVGDLYGASQEDLEQIKARAVHDKCSVLCLAPAKATFDDVAHMVELNRRIQELEEERDEIKANFLMDAATDLEGADYKSYTVGGPDWSVTASYKTAVDLYRPTALQDILKDSGDLIVPKPTAYSVHKELSQLLTALFNNNIYDQSLESIIEEVAVKSGHPELGWNKMQKRIKGTFKANCNMLMKNYGLTPDEATDTAVLIQGAINYENLKKFARLADREGDMDAFIKDVLATIGVKETLAVQIEAE